MKPIDFENGYLVIDASMDDPIFPDGISHGLNVLNPHSYHNYYYYNDYTDFPEIDIDEFKDHI